MNDRRTLVGSRIQLVALDRRHLVKRAEFINNPAVQATLSFDYPTSLSKTDAWYSKVVLDASRVDLTIQRLEDQDIIGFCGFIGIDRRARKAEHYIFIGNPNVWRKGYGTQSYKLFTNYGFTELGLNRIWGYQLYHNKAALRLVEGLGWKEEGVLREDILSHGDLTDRRVISILRREWENTAVYGDL